MAKQTKMCIKRNVPFIGLLMVQLVAAAAAFELSTGNRHSGRIFLFAKDAGRSRQINFNPDTISTTNANTESTVYSQHHRVEQFSVQSKTNHDNRQSTGKDSKTVELKRESAQMGKQTKNEEKMKRTNIDQVERRPISSTVGEFIHQRTRRSTNESLTNDLVTIDKTAVAVGREAEEGRVKKYSYYYLARTLWYIPLYFLVYFTFYVLFLVVRSIVKHIGELPNTYSNGIGKRSIGESSYLGLDESSLNSLTETALKMIEDYAENYIKRKFQ